MRDPDPRRLMRRKARSFYLASRFLPGTVKRDVRTLYAYFRAMDDLADENSAFEGDAALRRVHADLLSPDGGSLMVQSVRRVARAHAIPPDLLLEVTQGATYDLHHQQFETWPQLRAYADLVAGSVGASLCYVLGVATPDAVVAARTLGIAMQLTNVLRDVDEDLTRGRVYIPTADLSLFGYTLADLDARLVDDRWRGLMRYEIERNRQLYQQGLAGLPYLHPRCRLAVAVAAQLYAGILAEIERRDFAVFSRRAVVPRVRKLFLVRTAYRLTNATPDPHRAPPAHPEAEPSALSTLTTQELPARPLSNARTLEASCLGRKGTASATRTLPR